MKNLRRHVCATGAAVLLFGAPSVLQVSAHAEETVLPESCKLHPSRVVNPGCVPAIGSGLEDAVDELEDPGRAFPDLVPNVTEVSIDREVFYDFETGTIGTRPPVLAFDTYAQNLGDVPLDLLTDDATNHAGSTVSQCVAWTTDFVCRERVQVGGFSWHEEHGHFHYSDFATYELRRLGADGAPDYSAAGLVAVSEKVSFCLMDSDMVEEDALPFQRYSQCSNTNQGVSPGWTDIYGSFLDGQQFPADSLADGRYALIVDMDTAGRIFEEDDTNNRVVITVEITEGTDTATILDRQWP